MSAASTPLRLVVVYHELPYPMNHGGRLDVWRRLQALAAQGVLIHLVCWRNAALGEDLPAADSPMRQMLHSLTVLDEKGKFANSHLTLGLPGYARRRLLTPADWAKVQGDLKGFGPQALLLEGPFAYSAAQQVAKAFALRIVYRSHNIESRYARFIHERAKGIKERVNTWLNVQGIDELEESIFSSSAWYFDCSPDDAKHWHARGHRHGEWLPLVVEQNWAQRVSQEADWSPGYHVGYLGNLYQPNNVEGIVWFLDKVVPQLRQRLPDLKAFIAGSRPSPEVRAAAERANVALIENPPEAEPILRSARVLINPVFAGSGVYTKCIEMLFTPAGLVATPIAMTGLAEAGQKCFGISDDPTVFAELIVQRQAGAAGQKDQRDAARACYDGRRIGRVVEVLRQASQGPISQATGDVHAPA